MKSSFGAVVLTLALAGCGAHSAWSTATAHEFLSGCEGNPNGGGGTGSPGACRCFLKKLEDQYSVSDITNGSQDPNSSLGQYVMQSELSCRVSGNFFGFPSPD